MPAGYWHCWRALHVTIPNWSWRDWPFLPEGV